MPPLSVIVIIGVKLAKPDVIFLFIADMMFQHT
jgi:hypothetical protein